MIVKGDEPALKKALNSGFSDCITKPFDPNKTEAVMYRSWTWILRLDTSSSSRITSTSKFRNLSNFVINDIKENMDNRIRNTINEGIVKLIIDVSELAEPSEESIEVVGEFAEKIEDMKLPMRGAIIATGEDADVEQLGRLRGMGYLRRLGQCQEHLAQDIVGDGEEE